jgi:hypothetical protein
MSGRVLERAGVAVALLVVATTVGACCCWGDGDEDRIAQLEKDVKTLEKNKKLKEAQVKQADAILNRGSGSVVVFGLHPKDVEKGLKDAFPITFPASNLHNLVKGTVVVSGMRDIAIKGDDVSFELYGKGKDVKVEAFVGPYEKMAKELIAGIEAGLTLKVNGKLSASADGSLRFKGKVIDANLKKHNKDDYRSLIRSEVNKRLFKRAHTIDLSKVDGLELKVATARSGRALLFFAK